MVVPSRFFITMQKRLHALLLNLKVKSSNEDMGECKKRYGGTRWYEYSNDSSLILTMNMADYWSTSSRYTTTMNEKGRKKNEFSEFSFLEYHSLFHSFILELSLLVIVLFKCQSLTHTLTHTSPSLVRRPSPLPHHLCVRLRQIATYVCAYISMFCVVI